MYGTNSFGAMFNDADGSRIFKYENENDSTVTFIFGNNHKARK